MYEKLDRISTTDGQLATIKYIGTLPNKIWGPNVEVLGVEWDQPERGKNNGTLEGVSYFVTEIDGAGSFIKLSNKKIIKDRNTFIEAFLKKHSGGIVSEDKVTFGTKIAESYGFEKLNEIQSDFNNLVSISLERQYIYTSFNNIEQSMKIFNNLNNITNLDLSYNLFNNLGNVWEIIDELKNLEELSLNGNRFFEILDDSPKGVHNSLNSIKLASTNIKLKEVIDKILPRFPNLISIVLAGNRYNDEDLSGVLIEHQSLVNLDLSFNNLTVIPLLKNNFNVISVINLADNCISNINKGIIFDKVHSLDLRNNQIDDLGSVDSLYLSFPELTELRINGNPIFNSMSVEEMTINLIARFECLGSRERHTGYKVNKINGAKIMNDEILNAELYFISKVKKGEYSYDRKSKRWQELIKKYHLNDFDSSLTPIEKNKLSEKKILLNIHFKSTNMKIERIFLTDNTILKLKGVISRYINLSILKFKVYYYIKANYEIENKEEQYLDDNIATIGNFGFLDGQNLYVIPIT